MLYNRYCERKTLYMYCFVILLRCVNFRATTFASFSSLSGCFFLSVKSSKEKNRWSEDIGREAKHRPLKSWSMIISSADALRAVQLKNHGFVAEWGNIEEFQRHTTQEF